MMVATALHYTNVPQFACVHRKLGYFPTFLSLINNTKINVLEHIFLYIFSLGICENFSEQWLSNFLVKNHSKTYIHIVIQHMYTNKSEPKVSQKILLLSYILM